MIVKLLTEHLLEFLSLKGCCRGLSESTLVKMSNCWKSYAAAHMQIFLLNQIYDTPCSLYCLLPNILLNKSIRANYSGKRYSVIMALLYFVHTVILLMNIIA